MQYQIENEEFRVRVDALGAELREITRKQENHEYMWSGNPDIWKKTAPILFPIVGRLKDGYYNYQNQRYTLKPHGFASEMAFAIEAQEANRLTLSVQENAETMASYPFPFWLGVEFSLTDNRLRVTHTLRNTGDAPQWFSLGAHPGFACDLGDVLRFEKAETIAAYRLEDDLLGGKEPFLDGQDEWKITADSFARDAYMLEGLQSKSVTLERAETPRWLRFHWQAPYLGIWAKPGASYVCLEPWFGIDEGSEHNHEFTQKKGIQSLAPGETFALEYCIELL